MFKVSFNVWTYIATSLFLIIGTVLKNSQSLEELPIGCDEFGYLQLAESFDERNDLGDHQERTYFKGLYQKLINEGFASEEFTWMITPHAYHYEAKTDQIINQYAPATSWLLSLIPQEIRQIGFPALILLLWFAVPFLTVAIFEGKESALKVGITTILLFPLLTLYPSLSVELSRINSIAPTWALLITAGYFVIKKPSLSIFFIALSGCFRQVNLLLLLPFIYILWPDFIAALKSRRLEPLTRFFILYFGPVLLGLLPYLLYAGFLLNNPFSLTYSSIDATMATLSSFKENMAFYFVHQSGWFLIHLIGLSLFFILAYKHGTGYKRFIAVVLFPFAVYLFFLTHSIQIPYYPYASALVILGICSAMINKFPFSKWIGIIPVIFGVVFFIDGINRYSGKPHLTFTEARNMYNPLCDYDVVWGDLYTGTSEYACNNYGFLMHAGQSKARIIAFDYLKKHGYSQLILLNDTPLPKEQLERELNKAGMPYSIISLGNLGIGIKF